MHQCPFFYVFAAALELVEVQARIIGICVKSKHTIQKHTS